MAGGAEIPGASGGIGQPFTVPGTGTAGEVGGDIQTAGSAIALVNPPLGLAITAVGDLVSLGSDIAATFSGRARDAATQAVSALRNSPIAIEKVLGQGATQLLDHGLVLSSPNHIFGAYFAAAITLFLSQDPTTTVQAAAHNVGDYLSAVAGGGNVQGISASYRDLQATPHATAPHQVAGTRAQTNEQMGNAYNVLSALDLLQDVGPYTPDFLSFVSDQHGQPWSLPGASTAITTIPARGPGPQFTPSPAPLAPPGGTQPEITPTVQPSISEIKANIDQKLDALTQAISSGSSYTTVNVELQQIAISLNGILGLLPSMQASGAALSPPELATMAAALQSIEVCVCNTLTAIDADLKQLIEDYEAVVNADNWSADELDALIELDALPAPLAQSWRS